MGNLFVNEAKIFELIEKYGSPLYIYDEKTIRLRCKEMSNLLPNKNFKVSYSAKANSNMEILKIIKDEDIDVDAVSAGEVFLQLKAGFPSERIFYIGNNVSAEEMKYAIDNNVLVSVDSLAQLRLFGQINPKGNVAIRFNPEVGAGHHEKVVTAGKKTKFGVSLSDIPLVKEILREYNLKLIAINQHVGSLFLEDENYLLSVENLLETARQFDDIEIIDMGGGFGIPYHKNEKRLDLAIMSMKLDKMLSDFLDTFYNSEVLFRTEPGRYIVAESGILLGSVYSIKENSGIKYVGTDIGFNALARPVMYDSYHEVEVINKSGKKSDRQEAVTIVGNICESGDIIAKLRMLPIIEQGDIIAVMDAGAYGFSMSSNYNSRLRPAEVLIAADGTDKLIRRRDTFEDLLNNY